LTLDDVVLINRIISGKVPGDPAVIARADLTGDGTLTSPDASQVRRKVNGGSTAPGPSGPKGQWSGPELFFIHPDHLGTPRVVVDMANRMHWRWDHATPFGDTQADESFVQNGVTLPYQRLRMSLRFPGQQYDVETGLHYNYYRDYDPQTGRYSQPDPIGLGGGINTYGYAGQDPLRKIDPDGRAFFLVIPGLCAAGGCEILLGGTALWCILTQSHHIQLQSGGQDSDTGQDTGGANPPTAEKDKRRFFDKGQRERARDRSRDADGDPTCEYCGVKTTNEPGKPNSSQIDHIEPWSRGGRTSESNSANSCARCNPSKGAKELGTEWIPPRNR
jgi:RHS repeat-associated protein